MPSCLGFVDIICLERPGASGQGDGSRGGRQQTMGRATRREQANERVPGYRSMRDLNTWAEMQALQLINT